MRDYFARFRLQGWAQRLSLRQERGRALFAPAVKNVDAFGDFSAIGLTRLENLVTAPVWMSRSERLLLYCLVYAVRPANYLEIGTLHGGSAQIVCAALDELGVTSKMTLVDPAPRIEPATWAIIQHRASIVQGTSPSALTEAERVAGGKFDFALVDGDHRYQAVYQDLVAVLAHSQCGAYILCHDCFYPDVQRAVDHFVRDCAEQVVDFGALTREVSHDPAQKSLMPWGGIRVVQVRA